MNGFALGIVDILNRSSVKYGDVRVVHRRSELFQVKNGALQAWSDEEERGFGVRVVCGGFWGFAAANELSQAQADRTVAQALRVARASAVVGGQKVRLAPAQPRVTEYAGPCVEDPFLVSAEDKIGLLLRATEGMAGPAGVAYAQAHLGSLQEAKVFASTEGALISQTFTETGGGVSMAAIRDGDVQTRSYPSAGLGSWGQGGFEYVRGLDLAAHAPRLAEEAVALLSAPACQAAVTTLILDADQMALQVHESVGHLGRMLKDCTYTDSTPAFWKSCDAVCDQDHWRLFGVTNCGKGEPGQTAHVSHGVSPARFRHVKVGVE